MISLLHNAHQLQTVLDTTSTGHLKEDSFSHCQSYFFFWAPLLLGNFWDSHSKYQQTNNLFVYLGFSNSLTTCNSLILVLLFFLDHFLFFFFFIVVVFILQLGITGAHWWRLSRYTRCVRVASFPLSEFGCQIVTNNYIAGHKVSFWSNKSLASSSSFRLIASFSNMNSFYPLNQSQKCVLCGLTGLLSHRWFCFLAWS